ncbi:RagB/SusD family nutrient uptake outer membrane protein [Pedobacter sp. N36a]|uniref:RagB/SusD family nutrient uptake outer membrane protein n=1 Tax=Pedobacter sp. N36a TaxID=2767996 RepID=UPI0016569309|nr:RagB/SusD family nutrient uptake outer membrane protein [Pedobacter sp. N36a]MBC8988006.1 RagB/SusD family nutrient uptake outer membrane protein [Pedobacter sp. N36a]
MKNINHAAGIFICLVLLFTGCKKQILDLTPQDKITDAQFWKTSSDLQLYVNGFYSRMLPTYNGFNTLGIYGLDADQGSDNMILTSEYNRAINGERTVPATDGAWSWSELRNINYFLANYNRVQAAPAAVNPFVGEALFFRAWFYFDKMKAYGDVPWINIPLSVTDQDLIYGARLKRNIIADSILNDLDRAIALLPTKALAQGQRINKEIAMAFQSRIALYEGAWEKYHAGTAFGVNGSDGKKYLEKAAAVSEALINSNVYQLDNTGVDFGYWKLFNQSDYSASKEIMFWRKYSITDNPAFGNNWVITIKRGGGRGITKNLVDTYLCTDGQPISGNNLYSGDNSLLQVVANRDPRLNQTICTPDGKHTLLQSLPVEIFTLPGFTGAISDKTATGYQSYKGLNPDPVMQQNISNIGYTGLIYFRYAEVLLNFAEAKAELGTLTQADIDKSIKKLRDRVGMPNLTISAIKNDPNWEFPELSGLINEVRRERRVELAVEGFRKDDIFRWASANKLLVGWKPKGAKRDQWNGLFPANVLNAYPVDANGYIELYQNIGAMSSGYKFNLNRDYLSPVPQNELTLNPKLLPQNPGW